MLELKGKKRIIMTTDWHLGARSNSIEWFEIMKDYFENFFIPWLQKNATRDDVIYHLGDVFDNRQSISLLVASYSVDLFERIAKIAPVYIIVGNHDIYRKNTNEISSVDILKHIKNITIYKEPIVHLIDGKRCLLMPWRRDHEHENETLKEYKDIDYLFCHSEVRGLRVNSNPNVIHDGGNPVENYAHISRIYSGHIHYSQQKENWNFIGNPYQMTRSDRDNVKGIWTLSPKSGDETFTENDYSPRFIRMNLKRYFDMKVQDLEKLLKNNHVDLMVPSSIIANPTFSSLIDILNESAKKIEIEIVEKNNEEIFDDMDAEEFRGLELMGMVRKYLDSSTLDDEVKNKVQNTIAELYKQFSE